MVQRIIAKSRFGEEAEEYLKLKGKTTRGVYGSAFELFLRFYQSKYGKGKGFSHFLDRIFAELQKPRRARAHALIVVIKFLQM